jgi:hypothetical protein
MEDWRRPSAQKVSLLVSKSQAFIYAWMWGTLVPNSMFSSLSPSESHYHYLYLSSGTNLKSSPTSGLTLNVDYYCNETLPITNPTDL